MRKRPLLLVLLALAGVALLPLTAQATAYTWSTSITGTLGTWNTTTDWTPTAPTGGPSGTTNTATINNATATTVQLNTAIASLGTLTIGSADGLSINTGGSLKANSIVLNGGSLTGTGTGTLTSPTPISGYGTITSLPGLGTMTANNATYGNAIKIQNITQNGAVTLGFSSKGTFNLSNVTLGATGNTGTILTFSGGTTYSQFTNPLPGTFNNNWGNVNYGLANVTGNTTLNGGINLANYYVLYITGSTLTVNNPGTIAGFNTSSPPIFVLGTGGNLVLTGNTALGNSAPIPINGGSITHTGGTFTANNFMGYGSISGVTGINGGGNVTASGGTLTFNGGSGITLGSSSSGANLNSSAGGTLDLQGMFTWNSPAGFIAPAGGTIQFDNATFAAGATSPTLSAGTINVTNNSFLTSSTGAFNTAASLGIYSGKTLDISGAKVNLTGGSLNNLGNLAMGGGTLNNNTSIYSLTGGGNISLAGGTISGTNGFTSNNILSGYGTISAPFTNTGTVTLTGGTSTVSGAFTNQAGGTVNVQTNPASFGTVTNNGTVNVSNAAVTFGNFTNNGVYTSDPSTQTFLNLTEGSGGYIQAAAGDIYQIKGDFINNSTQNTSWNTAAAVLDFISNGTATGHNVALAGADFGKHYTGYTNNFVWNSMDLTGQTLTLSDGNTANNGTALYLGTILGVTYTGNLVTDITGVNGINVYYDPLQSGNAYLHGQTYNLTGGGTLAPVPVPPSVLLLGSGLLGLVALRAGRKKS